MSFKNKERGMSDDSRRQFLIQSMTGVSAAWLAASWPEIAAAAEAARSGGWGSYAAFTQAEGAEVEAMAAQIFPTTDTPGAREAQVIDFIDMALTGFAKEQLPAVKQGLADLHTRAAAMGGASFAALSSAQQIQLLTA